MENNGGSELCDLKVRRIRDDEGRENLLMVIFEETENPAAAEGEGKGKSRKKVALVEEELRSAREQLQTTIEELETSNEELQSSNEELQSANEELQSTNEELEVSKEELQSLNEELMTSNAELQDKIDQLSMIKDDMNNLLASIEIATIFLDTDLNVKRFTPSAIKHFKLIDSDVGRPLSDIVSTLTYPDLENDIREVLRTLTPLALEVTDRRDNWYQLKILPYRTVKNTIEGLVLTIVDISRVKLAELSLMETELRCNNLLEQMRDGVVLLDADSGRILDANPAFRRLVGQKAEEISNLHFREMVAVGKQKFRKLLAAIIEKGEESSQELVLRQAGGGKQAVSVNGRLIHLEDRKYIQAIVRKAGGPE